MDIKVTFWCERVVDEDGVVHSVSTSPSGISFVPVKDDTLNTFEFWDALKGHITNCLKVNPALARFKKSTNRWGRFEFESTYHSVLSGWSRRVSFDTTHLFLALGRKRNPPILTVTTGTFPRADLWVKVTVHMEKGEKDFLDSVRTLIETGQPDEANQ